MIYAPNGVIDEGTPTDETLPVDPATMGAVAAKTGKSIGRFVVLDLLGQGAMGIVLAAYDPDLDRKVALKLLRTDGVRDASSESIERMIREARAMAKLSHPNVLAIHEAGMIDGRFVLAMEFAPGGTLRAWCSAARRPWREVVDKFVQAGRGLEAAHEAGLVHRDFKPANVLLAKKGEVRVSDFGLVGVHATNADDPRDADNVSLTSTGTLLGTPAYMAPEQHDRSDVGPAADQFAFCVSLWEALYGSAPFEGTTVRTLAENVRAHRLMPPPPTTDVPAWIAAVLRRGLAVKPADRWPSMTALLAELSRDPAFARRRRLRWGAAIAGIAFVGSMAAFAVNRTAPGPRCANMERSLTNVWSASRASELRAAFDKSGHPRAADTAQRVSDLLDRYATTWVDARRNACEATHVHGDQSTELLDLRVSCLDRHLVEVDALVDRLLDAPTKAVVDKSLPAALRLAPVSACHDTEALRALIAPPPDPATRKKVDEIRAASAAAKSLGEVGQAKAGRAKATEVAAAAEQVGYTPLVAETLGRRGRLEQLTGDYSAAEATMKAAILAAAEARDDRLVAQQWGHLIYLISDVQQRPAEALQLVPAAEAAVRRAGNQRELAANQQAIIARVLIANGKLAVGHEMLLASLKVKEEINGRESFEVARELGAIGNVLQDLGQYDDSIKYLERALAIWQKTYGPDHPDAIMQEANLANAYESKGNFAEARKRHERVLAGFIKSLGPEHPHVGSTHVNIGNTLTGLEEYAAALESFERALAIQTKVVGTDHPIVGQTLVNMAAVYIELAQYAKAQEAVERALSIYEASKMENTPLAAFALVAHADILRERGRAGDAIHLAERSLKIRVDAGAGADVIAESNRALGHALLAAGRDRTRAVALLGDARKFYANDTNGSKQVAELDKILAKYPR